MDLSILTVSYRSAEDTLRCFHSLEDGGAEGLDWELLVGDNGSGDIERLGVLKDAPRVRLSPNTENLGFGRENNRLSEAARGEFLLCLNPDTIVPRGTLKALVDHLRTHPECGACGPSLRNADGTPQHSWNGPMGLAWEFAEAHYLQNLWRDHFERKMRREHPKGPWAVSFSSGACLCLRTTLFQQLGGFDPDFFLNHEDIELCHRIRESGQQIHVLPSLTVTHLDGASQRRDWTRFVKDRLDAKRIWLGKRFHGIALALARLLWFEGVLLRIALSFLFARGDARTRLKGYFGALREFFHD